MDDKWHLTLREIGDFHWSLSNDEEFVRWSLSLLKVLSRWNASSSCWSSPVPRPRILEYRDTFNPVSHNRWNGSCSMILSERNSIVHRCHPRCKVSWLFKWPSAIWTRRVSIQQVSVRWRFWTIVEAIVWRTSAEIHSLISPTPISFLTFKVFAMRWKPNAGIIMLETRPLTYIDIRIRSRAKREIYWSNRKRFNRTSIKRCWSINMQSTMRWASIDSCKSLSPTSTIFEDISTWKIKYRSNWSIR